MVSVVSTGVTLIAIAVLGDVGPLNNAQAATVATACGFACSYPLNRRWAFNGGAGVGHTVTVFWLGGLSLVGLLLSGATGAAVDALTAQAHLGSATVLAAEETAESLVLGALFFVRFQVSHALFTKVGAR